MSPQLALIAAAVRDPFLPELVQPLQAEGWEVLVSRDLESTLKTARTRKPALVVLDTVLEGGDGFSLCRRLKEDPATTAIPVFCFSVLMARDRSLEAGADGFMLKPLELDLLLRRIREVGETRVRQLPLRMKQR